MILAIIVAAGSGVRMNMAVPKQYLDIAGEPILVRTVRTFKTCDFIDAIWLAVPPGDIQRCREMTANIPPVSTSCHVTPGGASRQESVYRALVAMEKELGDEDLVVIHDGVRPLVSADQIESCVSSARSGGACVLAVPVSDTVKIAASGSGHVTGTLERQNLWLAQTPQVFQYRLIRKAHEEAIRNGVDATDDAMLVEISGGRVQIVPGSRENIKITTPEDLSLGEAILYQRAAAEGGG